LPIIFIFNIAIQIIKGLICRNVSLVKLVKYFNSLHYFGVPAPSRRFKGLIAKRIWIPKNNF